MTLCCWVTVPRLSKHRKTLTQPHDFMPQKTWILTTTVVGVSEPSLMKHLNIVVSSYDGSALECRNFLWKKVTLFQDRVQENSWCHVEVYSLISCRKNINYCNIRLVGYFFNEKCAAWHKRGTQVFIFAEILTLNSVATQQVFSCWTGVTAPRRTPVTFVFSRKIQIARVRTFPELA